MTYSETTFGGDFETAADYRDPYLQKLIKDKGGTIVWPLIRYSYDTHNLDLPTPAPSPPTWMLTEAQCKPVVEKKGLKIILNKNAVGYHEHSLTLGAFCKKMEFAGFSATLMLEKHPELKNIFMPVHPGLAKTVFDILKSLRFLDKARPQAYWYFQIVSSYLKGFEEGLSKKGLAPFKGGS